MVTAIVPAAGESRRMGQLKPLLPFGSRSILEQVVASLRACPVQHVIVVTGHRADEIEAALAAFSGPVAGEAEVSAVRNRDYATGGMLSSIQRGMIAASPQTDWFVIALADQPSLDPETVAHLLRTGEEHRASGAPQRAFIPTWAGRGGHPVLIHATLREEVLGLPLDQGLRGLWARRPDAVRFVPVGTPAVLTDIDTPEDYARALADRATEGSDGD